jgi:hypothetical protein
MRFYQTWKIYPQIKMKRGSVLPDKGFFQVPMQVHDRLMLYVHCLPKGKGGAKHRVIATCLCGRKVPFGRLGQHYKACEALQKGLR